MLSRIANKTTIHGMQDAWRANWVGRAFFLSVFACCFSVMVIQLKGLVIGYIIEAVGTRVTSSTKFDTIEQPSFYYCNRNWVPTAEALWRYKPIIDRDSSLNRSYHRIYKDCIHKARYNVSLDLLNKAEGKLHALRQYLVQAAEPGQHCKPYLEYWKSMIKQELVNAIVEPFGDIDYDEKLIADSRRDKRPELSIITANFAASILKDPVQNLLNSDLREGVQVFVENSVLNLSLDGVRKHEDRKTRTSAYTSSSAIMSQAVDLNGRYLHNDNFDFYLSSMFQEVRHFDPLRKTYEVLSNNTLHPSAVSASLDGVCLEYPSGPQYVSRHGTMGQRQRHKHVVLHLGGLVHHLRALGYQALFALEDLILATGYVDVVGGVYEYRSHVAVSKQKARGLYFSQKIQVNSGSRLVNVKYWTYSYAYLNKKAWQCRPAPWTELDQAHCNQELSKASPETFECDTHLPASAMYPETPVTNDTCIYDHTGIFNDILAAMSDVKFPDWTYTQPPIIARQLSSFGPSRVSYKSRTEVVSRLTDANPDCPRPCSRTVFNVQVSYPSPDKNDVRLCHIALAYWLTPQSVAHAPSYDLPSAWFHELYVFIKRSNAYKTPLCSVIEYEQVEAQDLITEEYLLYGLSDLAANIGGTVGLWLGASVISIVQLFYLCCLKKRFRRIRRKLTEAPAKQLRVQLKKLSEGIQSMASAKRASTSRPPTEPACTPSEQIRSA